jgi:Ca2+-transporting ATPase
MLDKYGCNYQEMRSKFLKEPFVRFQFTSRRKKMSTILTEIDDNEFGYDKRLHIKGAAEIVLNSCTNYLDVDGESRPLDDDMKNHIIK